MGIAKWVRSCLAVVALSFIACAPARAVLLDENQSTVGDQTFDYTFTAPTTGSVLINLLDQKPFGVSFAFLGLTVDSGGPVLLSAVTPPALHSFSVMAGTEYFLSVYAESGAVPGTQAFFGKYHVTVSDVAPVPEPTVWLMMLGGISLLGWMRLRKSESMG